MSEKEDKTIDISEEEYQEFKRFQEYRKREKEQPKEEPKKVEAKKRAWTCRSCGATLGPADWDERQLTRQHPDGCPRCGSTAADIQ